MSTKVHTVHIGTLTVTSRFTVSHATGNYVRYIWDSKPIIIVGETLRYKFQSKNITTRTAVSHSNSDPDELDGLDGISGLDESTNHGSSTKSDTSGRRTGSSTRICRSNVINPSVSSTLEKDRTLCSREVLRLLSRVLEKYDAPGEPNEQSEYSRDQPPYLTSPSIPQGEVQ